MSSLSLRVGLGVHDVAEGVSDDVDAYCRYCKEQRREEPLPPVVVHDGQVVCTVEHIAPCRARRRDAESEVRQRRFCKHTAGKIKGKGDYDYGNDVRKDMLEGYLRFLYAHCLGSGHILVLARDKDLLSVLQAPSMTGTRGCTS